MQYMSKEALTVISRSTATFTNHRSIIHTRLQFLVVAALLVTIGMYAVAANDETKRTMVIAPVTQASTPLLEQMEESTMALENENQAEDSPRVDTTSSKGVHSEIRSSNVNGQQETEVIINGRNIKVPESGELHTTVVSETGSASVEVQTDYKHTGTETSSSLNVTVQDANTKLK